MFDLLFTPFTRSNLKWIIDLNVKDKSIEHLEDNFYDPEKGKNFSDKTKSPNIKTVDELDYQFKYFPSQYTLT